MPPFRVPTPASLGLAVFATGVAAGIGFVPSGSLLAGAAAALVGWLSRRAGAPALVLIAGIGHGAAARALDARRCASILEPGPVSLVVEVREPAPPGRAVPVRLTREACRGSLSARFPGGDTVWAGQRLEIEGTWTIRPGPLRPRNGIIAVTARRQLEGRFDWNATFRNRLIRSVATLYGGRSGMIEALLIGTRGTIDPEVSAVFARTGLVHLLSISGFHVGLVWAWLVLLFRLAGQPRAAPVVAAVVVTGYVAFIGGPPPAVRAALLAIAVAIERHRQRQPATGALFATVAWLVLLVDPWAIGDLGAWLSATALWGATAATRWSDRAIGPAPAWRTLAGSIGATVATAPITAGAFGAVPLVGVGLNLVAIPVTALAVPAVIASLVAVPWSVTIGAGFAAGGGALLALLESIAHAGAAVPGAALDFEAGLAPAAVAGGTVALVAWSFGSRHTAREAGRRLLFGLTGLGALHALIGGLPRTHTGSRLTLHFLAVGQGDAALLETPNGRWILVDAGPSDGRRDAGQRVIVPFLRRHGVRRLDAAFLSHAHRDHYGGLGAVLAAVPVGRVFDPAVLAPDREYFALLDAIGDRSVAWYPLRKGARVQVDGVVVEALHPDSGWAGWGEDLNEDSAILRITAGDFSAMFPGDAGLPAEGLLGRTVGAVDLLKVGHHGSRGATGSNWLGALRARAAVISVGVNRYGHPSDQALARLADAKVRVWRTDQDGTVTVAVDDSTMRIRGRRGEERLPIR